MLCFLSGRQGKERSAALKEAYYKEQYQFSQWAALFDYCKSRKRTGSIFSHGKPTTVLYEPQNRSMYLLKMP